MRDFAKIPPSWWSSKMARDIAKLGADCLAISLYLQSAPLSNMLGLYYLPKGLIAIETGMGMQGAFEALDSLIKAGFCDYDDDAQVVWVFDMAETQIGKSIKATDLQVKGIQTKYDALHESRFLTAFYERYQGAFFMTNCRSVSGQTEAPSKALPSKEKREGEERRSREKQQEQEQEHAKESLRTPASGKGTPRPKASREPADPRVESKSAVVWSYYAEAYQQRYGAPPMRNAKVNGQLAQLITRIPAEEAPQVADFYVRHAKNRLYVSAGHCVDLLLRDAEKLRTEWFTGRQVTSTEANQADRQQATASAFDDVLNEQRQREAEAGHAQ